MVIGLWTDHVLGYWNHRNQGNMMVMRYEDTVTVNVIVIILRRVEVKYPHVMYLIATTCKLTLA